MSRHRGAKHRRRYELLGSISLLSPAYLLSVERWPFHSEPPDHYDRLRLCSTCQFTVRQAYAIALHERFLTVRAYLRTPPLLFGRRPPQSNYPPYNVLMPDNQSVRCQEKQKRYFTGDSTKADAFASMSPSYAKYVFPNTNVKLQRARGLSV